MRAALSILFLGTLLALLTAGIGWHGFGDWDGESGGHWWAFVGLTFFGPLFMTESWTLAVLVHWAICTLLAWPVFAVVRHVRGVSASSAGSSDVVRGDP